MGELVPADSAKGSGTRLYTVTATYEVARTMIAEVEIEADSEAEAIEKAEEMNADGDIEFRDLDLGRSSDRPKVEYTVSETNV